MDSFSAVSVVLLKSGPQEGQIAVIAEVIDHNRVCLCVFFRAPFFCLISYAQAVIDGPTTGVPRQAFPYKHLTLTPLRLTKLPRAAGTGVVKKQLEAEAIVEKWNKSSFAQRRAAIEQRRKLNDFERFAVMIAKKQRADRVHKAVRAAKKA